jgi:hypothetical protein
MSPHPCGHIDRNSLGVAPYRVGDYPTAFTTFTKLEELIRKPYGDLWATHAANVVFLAMTNQRLGNSELSGEQLQRTRQLSRDPRWSENSQLQGCLFEAEALIESDPSQPVSANEPTTQIEPTTRTQPAPTADSATE